MAEPDPFDLTGLARAFTEELNAAAQRYQAQADAALAGLRNPALWLGGAPGSLADFELFRRIASDPALKAKVIALVQAEDAARKGATPPAPAPGG